MGLFGKSRSVSFFLSGEEQLDFLKRFVDENTVLLDRERYETPFPKDIKQIHDVSFPPSPHDEYLYILYRRDLGIDIVTKYNSNVDEYFLVFAPSPVVQFVCCGFNGGTLTDGRIAAMISYYDENEVEILKPKEYVDWWKSMERYLKKKYPLMRKQYFIRIGPGAIKMYKEGIHLHQAFHSKIDLTPADELLVD